MTRPPGPLPAEPPRERRPAAGDQPPTLVTRDSPDDFSPTYEARDDDKEIPRTHS